MSARLCLIIGKPYQAFLDLAFANYLCVRNVSLKLEFQSEHW